MSIKSFVISVEGSSRTEEAMKHLQPFNVTRRVAVDGKHLVERPIGEMSGLVSSLSALRQVQREPYTNMSLLEFIHQGETEVCLMIKKRFGMRNATWACALSHMLLYRDLVLDEQAMGYLIFEDDVYITQPALFTEQLKDVTLDVDFVNFSAEIDPPPLRGEKVGKTLCKLESNIFNMLSAYYISRRVATLLYVLYGGVLSCPADDFVCTAFRNGLFTVLVPTNPVCYTKGDTELWGDNVVNFTFRAEEGLGNHMFELASLYAVCKKRGHFLKAFAENRSLSIFHLSMDIVLVDKPIFSKEQDTYVSPTPCYDPGLLTTKCNTFKGYMQSEKHFEDYSDEINALFKFQPAIEETLRGRLAEDSSLKLALHIRLPNFRTDSDDTFTYRVYTPAEVLQGLLYIRSRGSKCTKLYIFSNDHERVIREYVPVLRSVMPIIVMGIPNDAEMCAMSLCDEYFLTAGSFGWWGAWLGSKRRGGQVYYMPEVFNDKTISTYGYYPDRWNKVPLETKKHG